MRIVLLLALSFLVGCAESGGDSGPDNGPGGIGQEIQPYVNEFQSIFGATINFKVDFDTIGATGSQNGSGTTVGVCRTWSNGDREVLINKNWWTNSGTDRSRRILIFHELGHCYFNRSHDSTKEETVGSPYYGMPRSVMYPVINPIVTWYHAPGPYSTYSSFSDYYHAELSGQITFPALAEQNMTYDPYAMTDDYVPSHEEDPGYLPPHDDCVHHMD